MQNNNEKQNGQALIEFIFFLPFMLMTYSVILAIGNAINGSINQQKAVRGYIFYRIQHNSTVPQRRNSDQAYMAWTKFGMYNIGWMDELEGQTPIMPCYKLNLPVGQGAGDECREAYAGSTTQYIRVGTVYGLCGKTYVRSGSLVYSVPLLTGIPAELSDRDSCLIR
jgi:hypothetical protein